MNQVDGSVNMSPSRKKVKISAGSTSDTDVQSVLSPDGKSLKKREDYLQWDEYFMALAFLSAKRSKDPSTQVGACIVNPQKKIVGIGYNGMPNGCHDDSMPWDRKADSWLETKYPYVCHAELNAILNKNTSEVHNCTIYVALFPCNECSKLIIQSGIKEVIFYSDKYHTDEIMKASRRLLNTAGVKYRQFQPKMKSITIDFTCIDDKTAPNVTVRNDSAGDYIEYYDKDKDQVGQLVYTVVILGVFAVLMLILVCRYANGLNTDTEHEKSMAKLMNQLQAGFDPRKKIASKLALGALNTANRTVVETPTLQRLTFV